MDRSFGAPTANCSSNCNKQLAKQQTAARCLQSLIPVHLTNALTTLNFWNTYPPPPTEREKKEANFEFVSTLCETRELSEQGSQSESMRIVVICVSTFWFIFSLIRTVKKSILPQWRGASLVKKVSLNTVVAWPLTQMKADLLKWEKKKTPVYKSQKSQSKQGLRNKQ